MKEELYQHYPADAHESVIKSALKDMKEKGWGLVWLGKTFTICFEREVSDQSPVRVSGSQLDPEERVLPDGAAAEENSRSWWECYCSCHGPDGEQVADHCMPCCSPCGKCGMNVAGDFNTHVREMHPRVDQFGDPWGEVPYGPPYQPPLSREALDYHLPKP